MPSTSPSRGVEADFGPGHAARAFLVAPDGFARAGQSATDNAYMADAAAFDAQRASLQHRDLQRAISAVLPTLCFAGDPATPDAVFPNNVFGCAPGRYVVGRMRPGAPARGRARRHPRLFHDVLGRAEVDLSGQPHACELTGSLVIDRARGLGYCSLSERCDEGRRAPDARGLRPARHPAVRPRPGEYHANVVLAVLAGRAPVVAQAVSPIRRCPRRSPVPRAARDHLQRRRTCGLRRQLHRLVCGNGMDERECGEALAPSHRQVLEEAGFRVESVALDAIRAGGGSLRCCIGEVF